jgi:hypothetical protein
MLGCREEEGEGLSRQEQRTSMSERKVVVERRTREKRNWAAYEGEKRWRVNDSAADVSSVRSV